MKISKQTRTNIIDIIKIEKIYWAGNLDEIKFLNRMFDLQKLPSNDSRFKDMLGDIRQHRINNPNDWEDEWIFTDRRIDLLNSDDAIFLQFLCEMLHPVVRPVTNDVYKLQQNFNECLKVDGYELVEKIKLAGKPIFVARQKVGSSIRSIKEDISVHINEEYLSKQISLMENSIDSDPHIAIGIAKELIETICKTILTEREKTIDKDWDVPKLLKETNKELKLTPEDIPDEAKASSTIKSILGSLSNVVQGIAELRNSYGSGHGRDSNFRGLSPRHAKLAVGAASTLATFLFETHKKK